MKNKVTPEDIELAIENIEYVVLPDERTTIALVTLDNGYTVRGECSCVDKANYNKVLGEQYALADAKRKIWPLLGFRLADNLRGLSVDFEQLYDKTNTKIVFGDAEGENEQRLQLGATFYDGSTGKLTLYLQPYQPNEEGESEDGNDVE